MLGRNTEMVPLKETVGTSSFGIGGQERIIWLAAPFPGLELTGLTHLLKGLTQSRIASAYFIDEYRLIGTVPSGDTNALILLDTSTVCGRCPGPIFEIGPPHVAIPCLKGPKYNVHHTQPFRENPSMGIVALVFRDLDPGTETTFGGQMYIIPARTLINFAQRIGTGECVPWRGWQHLAIPLGPFFVPSLSHILHSQVLSIHNAGPSIRSKSVLRVHDFSLRSRRRKVQGDPSEPLPPYTVQEFPLDADYLSSLFKLTESGILVTSVRIYTITKHVRKLTWCPSRLREAY